MAFIRGEKSRACRLGLLLPGLFFAALAHAETRWVHGSWVNVRETADAQSAVIEHVTTNTQVEVLTREGGRCEIAWKDEKRGFVPCGLLGERPLTLGETLKPPYGDEISAVIRLPETLKENPQYSPPRAFWISPSPFRLIMAGRYFQRILLLEKQFYLEQGFTENGQICLSDCEAPRLVRYPVPEFEAMKALLGKGIIYGADYDPPFSNCSQSWQVSVSTIQELKDKLEDWGMEDRNFRIQVSCQMPKMPEMPKLRLPEIRTSFFKNIKDILPGNADIGQISAHFGIVAQGRVVHSPRWVSEHVQERSFYSGGWDVGRYEMKLAKPVVEHVIGRNGRIDVYPWTPKMFTEEIEEVNCQWNGAMILRPQSQEQLLSRAPAEKETPNVPIVKGKEVLLWFQSPLALPLEKAKISRREGGQKSDVHATIDEIDLENDGVMDFVQWHFKGGDEEYSFPILRVTFANINGEWVLFEKEYPYNCGRC
ncbi:MAG: hypothetical protein LBU11_09660 [Zoogloeaceae bacterium]|jgi:hypothetical protein|nr:hypothetical protein [Zoogloeaceae bacterium]